MNTILRNMHYQDRQVLLVAQDSEKGQSRYIVSSNFSPEYRCPRARETYDNFGFAERQFKSFCNKALEDERARET